MTNLEQAARQALEALEYMTLGTLSGGNDKTKKAITTLHQALEQQPANVPKSDLGNVGDEPAAWDLAEKVRKDLDRKTCPDAFMRIAVESIVRNYTSSQPARAPQKCSLCKHEHGEWDWTCNNCGRVITAG